MYFVCSVDTRTPSNRLIYVSEVMGPYGQRMETNYTSTILERDFNEFLNSTYTRPGASHCTGYESVAKAKESITKALGFAAGAKLVETGWKSSAPAAPAASATAASASAPSGGVHAFCWLAAADYTIYISRPADFGVVNMQTVDPEFAKYVEATYGVRQSAKCFASRDAAQLEAERQRTMNQIKRTSKPTFVELDWTPQAKPVASVPAPGRGAPAAPSAPPVAAPPKQAPAQTIETFSYCYAYGTPQGPGTGKPRKQHYYVTPVFTRSATDRPDGDWQKFIRAAHTDEAFNASCTAPGPRATTDQKRTEQVASMRKLANFDVDDVDWKK
jgi:hypothetical protein